MVDNYQLDDRADATPISTNYMTFKEFKHEQSKDSLKVINEYHASFDKFDQISDSVEQLWNNACPFKVYANKVNNSRNNQSALDLGFNTTNKSNGFILDTKSESSIQNKSMKFTMKSQGSYAPVSKSQQRITKLGLYDNDTQQTY